jgi:peptide/nickel transport system permease protein
MYLFYHNMKQKKPSYWGILLKKFSKKPVVTASIVILAAEILLAAFLPFIFPLDPYTSYPGKFGSGPDAEHIIGFDDLGRDVFSRLVYGGRTSLQVGLYSALLGMCIGVPLGLLAGYYSGIFETMVMRCADVFMAFPNMVLMLVIVSVVGASMTTMILILGVMSWPGFARLLHGRILSIREMEYVEAAKAMGTNDFVILSKYVLPNAIPPALVQFAFAFSGAMTMEAGLSFLGVGIRPPVASWGNILYAAQSISVLTLKPWIWVPSGSLFLVTVLSVNFIGDGLRRALDPKAIY